MKAFLFGIFPVYFTSNCSSDSERKHALSLLTGQFGWLYLAVIFIYLLYFYLFSGWCYLAETTEAGPEAEAITASKESSLTAGGSSRHAGLSL